MKKSFSSVCGVIVGVVIVLLLSVYTVHSRKICFAHLNPEVECDTTTTPALETPLKNIVANKIHELEVNNNADSISVYYLSLSDKDNEWFSINNGHLYYPASYSKVPILMWFYSQDETGSSVMNDVVDYKQGAYNGHQHFDYGGITPGNTYTVPQLIESMITKSDNNAALALAQIIGPEKLSQTLLDLGLTLQSPTSTSYKIDTKTAASFFRMLFDASYLTPQDSEKALALLTRNKFTVGIKSGLPAGVEFANKFGEWAHGDTKQLHDCGIVYKPGHPYILCLMTEGTDFDALTHVLGDISSIVYTNVKN